MIFAYAHELQTAINAVQKACLLARKMQGTLEALDVVNKEDLSPVTITDFSCQALINRDLLEAFPDIPIMGEEDALFLRDPQNEQIKAKVIEQLRHLHADFPEEEILEVIDRGGCAGGPKGRFWVLDPIDGTRGFIRNEQYAVALALIENGEVIVAVLGCPRLLIKGYAPGGIFYAVKDQGAYLKILETGEERPVRVKEGILDMIYCEPQLHSSSHSHREAAKIAELIHAKPNPFRLDSQCKYAMVANGEASIYLRIPTTLSHREKIWDHAPGTLIVEEAGGKVTDLRGNLLDFSHGRTLLYNWGLLATNGSSHEKALDAAQQVLSNVK